MESLLSIAFVLRTPDTYSTSMLCGGGAGIWKIKVFVYTGPYNYYVEAPFQ